MRGRFLICHIAQVCFEPARPESHSDSIISCLDPAENIRSGEGENLFGEGSPRDLSLLEAHSLGRADLENIFARRKIATVGRNIGSVKAQAI